MVNISVALRIWINFKDGEPYAQYSSDKKLNYKFFKTNDIDNLKEYVHYCENRYSSDHYDSMSMIRIIPKENLTEEEKENLLKKYTKVLYDKYFEIQYMRKNEGMTEKQIQELLK